MTIEETIDDDLHAACAVRTRDRARSVHNSLLRRWSARPTVIGKHRFDSDRWDETDNGAVISDAAGSSLRGEAAE